MVLNMTIQQNGIFKTDVSRHEGTTLKVHKSELN